MSDVLVTIEQGQIRGNVQTDYENKEYFSFSGLPYAKPPVGPLRFKDPQPSESWTGVRDGTIEGSACYSKQMFLDPGHGFIYEYGGSEDCLYLNISTHSISGSDRKPVMVYIHGGGFVNGSGSVHEYGHKFLMTKDIVLVSINYRLGSLGFMALESEGVGNAGLKDQRMALQWVQKNIEHFGGDPNNVTIFGQSAGGASVHLQVISPRSEGLFRRAIAQSGCAITPWALGQQNNARAMAEALGSAATDDAEILRFLQSVSVEDLVWAQNETIGDFFDSSKVRYFGPVVEKASPDAFITEMPADLVLAGKFNTVDFMLGYTTMETIFFEAIPGVQDVWPFSYEHFVPHYVDGGSNAELNKKIINFYFGQDDVDLTNQKALFEMSSDDMFIRAANTVAKNHAKKSSRAVFLYRLSLETELSMNKKLSGVQIPVPIVNVEVVAGDPVYLPCDISMTDANDQVLLVLWYREDLGTPIYSVDGRDRDFSLAERWSDENVFANRAYFMPEKQPAELGVDHIRESDQAVYRCRVDFKVAQTRNSKVNLTVIVPPQKIVITNESGSPLTSVVGPFPEGASFTLRCDVFGAKPLPLVTWVRNELVVSNVSVVLPSGGTSHVRSELRITGLGRRDVHSELTCQASNNPRTPPLAATLHVDMNFGPLDIKILGANQPLSAGRRYDLLCQSSGSRPPASITWWRNGQRLEKAKKTTSNDGNTTTSTLSFVPKKEDDGKYLSCRAENKMMSSEALEDRWKLEIHYTPEAKIILGTSLNPDAIREGTDVYFDCTINAHPPVYKVEWRHNGKMLNININAGIIISNQSLVLQGVSRATAGNYTCVGYNTEGDGESNAFYLNVMYAPTCKPNQTRIYGVAKQEQAQITCQVDANPSDMQFRWTFNNSADSVDVAQSHIARSGTSSVVSYTPMTELDYGTLLCYASNRIGTQRLPCVFHIIAAGRPDQVHNCTISNISMTSFSIRCSEGFNGGLPQSFLLEVRESHSQEIKSNLSSPVARFSVTSLEAGAQYQAALFSYNTKGRSEPVILQAATLRLPEKQLTAEKDNHRSGFRFTPMMSVLIGVIAALLIVALVVILVLRLQCTHNDDRRKRHKNTVVTGGSIERRGSGSGPTLSDKGGGSPISKHDSSAGECDSDEKNPDIIPQPVDADEAADYVRKRQHVSTIETSPSRSLLHQAGNSAGGGGYIGYCTLRNGMPLHELAAQSKMHPAPPQMMGPYASCTLPRQPQQWQYGPVSHLPPGVYPVAYRGPHPQQRPRPQPREPPIPMQPLAATAEEEPSADTPLMVNKRESTV